MKSAIGLLILIISGCLGNYFSLPLMFGVDFIFGSIAALIVLSVYGVGWGILCVVMASVYTYFLWGHAYAVLIFTSEIMMVGMITRKKSVNLLLSDGIFWFFMGMPMVWSFYHMIMGMDATATLLIMLKQSINGIFNALVATFAINHFSIQKLSDLSIRNEKIPLRDVLFNFMVAIVLIPALVMTVLNGRADLREIEDNVTRNMISLSTDIGKHLRYWYWQHLHAIEELAILAGQTSIVPTTYLQKNTEIVKRGFQDFHNMYVADSEATTVAFYPPANERGISTIGLNFSDRDYFKKLKATHRPVVSDVFLGRGGIFEPIVTLSAPILNNGQFKGFALGALNLKRVLKIIEPYGETGNRNITLTDARDRIIASTDPKRKFMKTLKPNGGGVHQPVQNMVYQRFPDDEHLPEMTRFKLSYYMHVSVIDDDLAWKLIVEEPVAPLQVQIYTHYVRDLFVALCLAGLLFLFAFIISQKLSRPLTELADITKKTQYTQDILSQNTLLLKESPVAEIHSLMTNFKFMISTLEQNFQEIKKRGLDAEDANLALKRKITELEATERALRESDERFRAIFTATDNVSLVMTDTTPSEPSILEFSPGAEKIFGHKRDEIIGKPAAILHAPHASSEIMKAHRNILKTQQRASFETTLVRKSGDAFPALFSTYPLLDDNGEVYAVLVVGIDISEQKNLEAQLQRAEKMEALGTLAGGVAHDLNNVLSGIVAYPDLLLMQIPLDSPLRKPIAAMQVSGKRAATIVEDLLTLAKRGVAQKEVVNINHIISDFLESPEYEKQKSHHPGVEIVTHLEKTPLNMMGSPVHLSKTVMNLVSNAAEAMPDGGKIFISTENRYIDREIKGYDSIVEGDYTILTVSDAGIGISAEDMQKIFEPFYTKKVMGRGGTGLGMTVVWNTVKDHKGYIDIQSVEGEGTSITIYFPATRQDMAGEKNALSIEDCRGHGESILVVDDVKEQREIALSMLGALGYRIDVAASGEEAVEHIRRNPVELIILDMIMDPGIDGLDTYKKILTVNPKQKAIIVSGFSETGRVKEAQFLGAGTYVKKPYTLEKIGMAVKAELAK